MPKSQFRKAVCAAVLTCCFAGLTSAGSAPAPNWIGISTLHFQLYTTNDARSAAETLTRLENMHGLFEQVAPTQVMPQAPLEIIAFSSEKEYQPFRLNSAAFAYYQRTLKGDYIVLQDLAPEHYEVSVHEYAHFVFEHAGLKLPLWANEGLADLYSSLDSDEGDVVLGRAPAGRLEWLRDRPLIDLQTLTEVGRGSPYYQQLDKMRAFYAESWALTHMLALSPEYAPEFRRFLSALSNGISTRDALQSIYGKSLNQTASDLGTYVRQKQLPIRQIRLTASQTKVELRPLDRAQERVDLSLADLSSAQPTAGLDIQNRLELYSRQYPTVPDAEESLGFLALRQNRPDDARAHFAAAVERHSTSPDVLFYLAHLQFQAGSAPEPVMQLLARVLLANPDFYNAQLEMGLVAAKAQQFDIAAGALLKLTAPQPQHVYVIAYTLAYCNAQLNHPQQARINIEKARSASRSDQDAAQVKTLSQYIDQEFPLEIAVR